MKRIVYMQNGVAAVCVPNINTYPVREDITDEQAVERAIKRLPMDATNVQVVDESAIPTDRTFRNAWTAVPGGIEHDMDKAREIHKARLRVMRAPLFEPLERAQRSALVAGDVSTASELEAQLKSLRDVTDDPAIANAATVDDLKAAIPEVLK